MIGVWMSLVVVLLLVVTLAVTGTRSKSLIRNEVYGEVKICEELMSGDYSAKKDCIIRFDTFLNKSLGAAGVKGGSVGDKLKNAQTLFDRDSYNNLWTAHKLRNRLVHENTVVTDKEMRDAVKYFKLAIRRLLK